MSQEHPRNVAASVADRLLQRARRTGEEHQILLARFGLERLMYRLSKVPGEGSFRSQGAASHSPTGGPWRQRDERKPCLRNSGMNLNRNHVTETLV